MPRTNMGLDTRLTRYHRIGSPNARDRVEQDRPLECALCHGDKTVAFLVDTMEQWWGKGRRFDRAALGRLYGDLGQNVLLATLERGRAHEQAVAIALLGEGRVKAALPSLLPQLWHAYPIVRYFAKRALEVILERPLAVDLHAKNEAIEAAARAAVGSVSEGAAGTRSPGP
jgi:hypothetical protein